MFLVLCSWTVQPELYTPCKIPCFVQLDSTAISVYPLQGSLVCVAGQCRQNCIDEALKPEEHTPSISSRRSESSTIVKQKAKREAARVEYEFACMEIDIRQKQAELEKATINIQAQRDLLEKERNLAIAQAEYDVYLNDIDELETRSKISNVSSTQRRKRTEEYVQDQIARTDCREQVHGLSETVRLSGLGGVEAENSRCSKAYLNDIDELETRSKISNVSSTQQRKRTEAYVQDQTARTGCKEQVHGLSETVRLSGLGGVEAENSRCSKVEQSGFQFQQFSNYLIRKELLMTRFIHFNDRPESFPAWKVNFYDLVSELEVSAREELDLLIKYLGPRSSEQAKSLRNSNAKDPIRALNKIWERLEDRYGRPELIDAALKLKISNFKKIEKAKDFFRLYELADILSEILSMKEDERYRALLGQYDTSAGVNQVLIKLPYGLQQKWFDHASRFKQMNLVAYPPFSEFVKFISQLSTRCNDPGLILVNSPQSNNQSQLSVFKTDLSSKQEMLSATSNEQTACLLHGSGHSLGSCRAFMRKPINERKHILRENKFCFKCCNTNAHFSKNCKANVKCKECGSSGHCTAMHIDKAFENHGGESNQVSARCTTLCGDKFGRSCAKTVLVRVFCKGQPDNSILTYAIHDDQSNKTLASSDLFGKLSLSGERRQYSLSSCAGNTRFDGRHTSNIVVQALDGSRELLLPSLIECEIPNDRSEIPTPDVASHHPHLSSLVDKIPTLNPTAEIGLLIGRDVLEAHHVESQIIGPKNLPFAQKLALGWVIVGEVCLGQYHRPNVLKLNVNKTCLMRPTIFDPCSKSFKVKEDIFKTSSSDDQVGLSQNDYDFISIMDRHMVKNDDGNWEAPLPFKEVRPALPNNRAMVLKRANQLVLSLNKNPLKQQHMLTFMEQIFTTRAAEVAPVLPSDKECWYLPLFGVYHPRKPDKIRGVFDSSVVFNGHSLNDVLLSGPNMTNDLRGVLLRFRRNSIAVVSDIEQMFYSFCVCQEDRDFLRFFWFKDNNPKNPLIEYRMRVHVFGNTPSPAVATMGLRKAVADAEQDVKHFIEKDFYVDDGLSSCANADQAISLLKRAQQVLFANGKLRLHKIASNCPQVMNAFKSDDLDKNLRSVNLFADELPVQSSLGLSWDLNSDTFTFKLNIPERPFTKRGVLSAISSIFDPLGFLVPITISGRMLNRDITSSCEEWDQPLPEKFKKRWETWKNSLEKVENLNFPRMFVQSSMSTAESVTVHVFADASEKAISAVAYAQVFVQSAFQVGFIMGKSKLGPQGCTTIPRLELCAAVLATELKNIIVEQLGISLSSFVFYSDSKVVLGYLNNRDRRFYTYVSNRVQRILKSSNASQWHYVPSEKNPADSGTRDNFSPDDFLHSAWFSGPTFLRKVSEEISNNSSFDLVNGTDDCEIRPEVKVKVTSLNESFDSRFDRFSTLQSLIRAFSLLKRFCRSFSQNGPISPPSVSDDSCVMNYLFQTVQKKAFGMEMGLLKKNKVLPKTSTIVSLSPFVDEQDLMRVGGRLNQTLVNYSQQHPIIIPRKSHLANLLIRHYHSKVHHQGRLITEAAVRNAGLWVIGVKRLISSILHACVTCRKLRGKVVHQRMANLPLDRVTPGAPFTDVGIDTFGPWAIVSRKTRGGFAESKRWAILFTCLYTRAVHIEIVEDMTSSAFINALRRFVALRGPIKKIRSDRGTNFIGAVDDIGATSICVEKGPVCDHLRKTGIVWMFNTPHASHMGGVWERVIGIARRILDSMLLTSHAQRLTHEILCTFMYEVSAIINSRPIAPLSYDPDNLVVISPAMLLTHKAEPLSSPTQSLDLREMYTSQWKYVQILSNTFWKRWRDGYLQSLQTRSKWVNNQIDLNTGDIVLLKDHEKHRNNWPLGIVVNVFPSKSDTKVRTVEIRLVKEGKSVNYVRPVTELILLVKSGEQ